jgi:O-methyltransferase/8-demethyl-8-(2,3-dimethoxy-alpha-L-rhamnosyl)tetracenomycin-C 4'-O-methyltransferase
VNAVAPPVSRTSADCRKLYLDLMQGCLLGLIYRDPAQDPWSSGFDLDKRMLGRDWPLQAHSMIGNARMTNLRAVAEHLITHDVPGDFIETGIWRGGACIMMRAVLSAYGVTDRIVWCADSFEGLPPPDAEHYPADAGDQHHTYAPLAVSLDEVKSNFERYGLLDEQVKFLKGWFKDTLPSAPIDKLALLRLDGDMYESTMDALNALYDKVAPGGAIIVDDYGAVEGCRRAVADFLGARSIRANIANIDGIGAWWVKAR